MSLFDFFKGKDSNSETSQAESQQEEIIQEEKQDMIEGVEGLSSTTVKEVMIPRIDVDFIPSDCEKNELIEKILCTPGQFDIIEFLDFAMRDNNNGRLNYKKI